MSDKGTIANDNAKMKAPRLSMRFLWLACLYSIGFVIAKMLKSFSLFFLHPHLPIEAQRDIRQLRRHHHHEGLPYAANNKAEEHTGDGRDVEFVCLVS